MPVLRFIQPDRPAQDWSSAEYAQILRTQHILEPAYGVLLLEWGVTDQGAPWATLEQEIEGQVVAHFARLSHEVVVDFPALELTFTGHTLREAVAHVASHPMTAGGATAEKRTNRTFLADLFASAGRHGKGGLIAAPVAALWELLNSLGRRTRGTERATPQETSTYALAVKPVLPPEPASADLATFAAKIVATALAAQLPAQVAAEDRPVEDDPDQPRLASASRSDRDAPRDKAPVPLDTPYTESSNDGAEERPGGSDGPSVEATSAVIPTAADMSASPDIARAPETSPETGEQDTLLSLNAIRLDASTAQGVTHHRPAAGSDDPSAHHHFVMDDGQHGWVNRGTFSDDHGITYHYYMDPDEDAFVVVVSADDAGHPGSTPTPPHMPEDATVRVVVHDPDNGPVDLEDLFDFSGEHPAGGADLAGSDLALAQPPVDGPSISDRSPSDIPAEGESQLFTLDMAPLPDPSDF